MMLNGRRRRQRADIGAQHMRSCSTTSDMMEEYEDDGSCYPRISSRTGGYESSVASYLVSSTSEHASWSTGEDDRTIKANNTTTATSHELLKFRLSTSRSKTLAKSDTKPNKLSSFPGAVGGATKAHPKTRTASLPSKDRTTSKPKGTSSEGPGRTFLRKLVSNRQGFRVARNNTEATVEEDIVSDDSRTSPHRRRFALPIDDDNMNNERRQQSPLTYTTATAPSSRRETDSIEQQQQASNGYEILSHPNKTTTIVHSSLTQHLGITSDGSNLRGKPQRMVVDSDLVDTDDFENISNSDSSTFSQLLMTDGDLMKNRQRFGSGAIRLTVESLKEHEDQLEQGGTNQTKKEPVKAQRKHPFVFWRRAKCEAMDHTSKRSPSVPLNDSEKSRIEQKRQLYLQQQRQREFGSVTKEQRESIFDSLVDTKSRATQSTVSSTSSYMTPRCHGCPTTGAMVDTVSFWSA